MSETAKDAESCCFLGMMWLTGLGGAADRDRATKLLTAACDGGDRLACLALRDLDEDR